MHGAAVVKLGHVDRLGLDGQVDEGDEKLEPVLADGSIARAEVVGVGVRPAGRGLQGFVQSVEGPAGRTLQDARDLGRPESAQGDFDGYTSCPKVCVL